MGLASNDVYEMLLNKGLHSTDADAVNPATGAKYPFRLYVGKEATDEGDTMSMFDAGNGSQNPKFAIDSGIVHFRSRTTEYEDGHENLESIRLALEGSPAVVVRRTITKPIQYTILPSGQPYVASEEHEDIRYIGFWVQSSPAFVNRDENDRSIFTMHLRYEREPMGAGSGHRQTIGSHATT